METAKYKELAERFMSKNYPQFISRVDRIWDMLYELNLGENASAPGESKYQIGNGLAFGGDADPELSEAVSGIDIIVSAHKGVGSNKTIEDSIFKIRINTICDDREINPDLKQKLESTISEFLQSALTENVNAKNTKKEPLEYYVWTPSGEKEATEGEINKLKDNSGLYVDGEKCIAYNNGEKLERLKKSNQGFNILAFFLENKGSAYPKDIYSMTKPDGKITLIKNMKKLIALPIHRLEEILKESGLGDIQFRGEKYHLDEDLNYVLVRRLPLNPIH